MLLVSCCNGIVHCWVITLSEWWTQAFLSTKGDIFLNVFSIASLGTELLILGYLTEIVNYSFISFKEGSLVTSDPNSLNFKQARFLSSSIGGVFSLPECSLFSRKEAHRSEWVTILKPVS